MDLRTINDADLIGLVITRSRDRLVLSEFIRRLGPLVLQTINWTLKRYVKVVREEAEDLFQEVFAALFENELAVLKQYDPGRAGIHTYLATIARNKTINALKKHKGRMVALSDSMPDCLEDEDLILENKESMEKIKHVIADLSDRDQFFFTLYFKELAPVEVIAQCMGIGVDTVYSKKAKIIEKLKTAFSNNADQA